MNTENIYFDEWSNFGSERTELFKMVHQVHASVAKRLWDKICQSISAWKIKYLLVYNLVIDYQLSEGFMDYDNLSKLNFQKQEYMKRHWIHYFMKEIVLNWTPDKTVILIVSPAELIIFNDIKNRRAWWWREAPSNKANPYWWKLFPTKPKSGQLVPN